MNRETVFAQQIALQADALYEHSVYFGEWAAQHDALGGDRRSQVKALERIANSTLKVTDVLDYLKKQTAKAKQAQGWKSSQGGHTLGAALIAFICDGVGQRRDAVCASVGATPGQDPPTDLERQQTHVALIREFVGQVAAQYELGGAP